MIPITSDFVFMYLNTAERVKRVLEDGSIYLMKTLPNVGLLAFMLTQKFHIAEPVQVEVSTVMMNLRKSKIFGLVGASFITVSEYHQVELLVLDKLDWQFPLIYPSLTQKSAFEVGVVFEDDVISTSEKESDFIVPGPK